MNNFLKRISTGSVYIAVMTVSVLTDPHVFASVAILLNILGMMEYRKMDPALQRQSPAWIYINTSILAVSFLASIHFMENEIALLGILMILISLSVCSVCFKHDNAWQNLVKSAFATLYISTPLALLMMLQLSSDRYPVSLVLLIFILIWINDSFAYVFGKLFGKHRLLERISPKKSWEGFFGGLAITLLASYLISRWFSFLTVWEWLIFGSLCTLAAVFGDFTESMLKRSFQVKDSGTLLPGHGGILDRIDSLLLVGPVIYAYLYILQKL